MVDGDLDSRVRAALAGVVNPRLGRDVVAAGMVRDLDVAADGQVHLAFVLGPEDPGTLVRDARRAVQQVAGVAAVRIDVHAPPPSSAAPTPKAVPAPGPREQPNLGHVIAVSSGKGGVGKSTVAVNLAAALAARGHRVGIMDGDIYGPNLPRMLGLLGQEPPIVNRRIQPLEAHGLKVMSLGSIIERDVATIWRGPIITKIIQQFLGDVEWGQLDFFIVDLPPGTGDAQLSLVQNVHVTAGIIVTTPQEVSVGDALRGAKMFEKVGVPVLGIIENMAGFVCPHCGQRTDIFSAGGGQHLADELGVPLLAQVPLSASVQELGESGKPVVLQEPDSPAGTALRALAERVETEAAARAVRLPIVG
jgi:ATP-binding protein involved in chromosome partitioning